MGLGLGLVLPFGVSNNLINPSISSQIKPKSGFDHSCLDTDGSGEDENIFK
jgi:hypothetical protein